MDTLSDFYVTLPSNVKSAANNTPTSFRVQLARRIDLTRGQWYVGLVEIIYPHTWFNVSNKAKMVLEWSQHQSARSIEMHVPKGYYENLQHQLLPTLGTLFDKHIVRFQYNPMLSRISVILTDEEYQLKLSPEIAYILGFAMKPEALNTDSWTIISASKTATNAPRLSGGIDILYVYSSIVQNQLVGDTLAPLLRSIRVSGNHGENTSEIYAAPYYIPVVPAHLSSIDIYVKDGAGQYIPFESGYCELKLHFIKRRPGY